MKHKILVLGASGMAGHTISLYMRERGHNVIGFDNKKSITCETIIGDARDTETLSDIVLNGSFDAVINCIGILNQYAEEKKDLAVFLNAYLPHFIAEITKDTNTKVVHMSTDCVFSGNRGAYVENDLRDGTTFYDRSKALGELDDSKNITLRNSIVGPDTNPKGIGLLNWFMQQNAAIDGYTKAMWTGLTTLELAKAMEAAINENAHGLYNMVYETSISKYALLSLFNQHLRAEKLPIKPVADIVSNKSLKRTQWGFSYKIPSYEVMVSELACWMKKHRNLYPHYSVAE